MPTPLKYTALLLLLLLLVPPALIARARAVRSDKTRIHYIQDMDIQPRFAAQAVNPMFADGRAMRPPVAGTVARGELWEDDHLYRGIVGGQWAATFPAAAEDAGMNLLARGVTIDLLQRGQERFNIYCSPCHGYAGYGDGTVNQRGVELTQQGVNGSGWVAAKSLHEQAIREQSPGQIFNTVSNGIRTMAGYASQVPVEDRWAIVAYVKALQRSQNASEQDES